MRSVQLLPLACAASVALAAELPRVAPPGPGVSSPSPRGSSGVEEQYTRRLDAADGPAAVVQRTPAPMAIYATPGGAVTNTGIPLSGQAGVLRDPAGGVWNCTGAGCFSPGGVFLPMKKAPPPAPSAQ